ncbi:hypothetical protein [Pseudomonas gingeri]
MSTLPLPGLGFITQVLGQLLLRLVKQIELFTAKLGDRRIDIVALRLQGVALGSLCVKGGASNVVVMPQPMEKSE